MSTGTVEFKIKITDEGGFKKLEVDADGFNNAVQRIKSETEKLGTGLGKFSEIAIGVNQAFDLVRNTVGRVVDSLSKIVDVGASNELQKLNLTTLFRGNAEAADDMFARISQYGKETVYDKEGLIDAQKTMMSFGVSGEQAFEKLKQIGDIAMGDSQKMQSLALAFSQATSTGKLMGQDLLQMINAGFNPLAVISEHTGESMESLKEKMSQGAISAEMLAQAFAWATEEGALFYKGAESAGNTTQGKINELEDTFNEFLINVFNQMQPVINAFIDFGTNVLNAIPAALENIRAAFGNVINTVRDFSGLIIGLTTAVASLTIAINANKIAMAAQEFVLNLLIIKEKIQIALTKAWKAVQAALNLVLTANPIGLIVSAIALLVGAIATVVRNTSGWGETWESVVNYINKSLGQMGAWFKLKWLQISDYFLTGIEEIMRAWYKLQALWDKDAAAQGLASMQSKAEERAKAIAEQKEILEGKAQERKETTVTWAVKWERKSKREKDEAITPANIHEGDLSTVAEPETEPAESKTQILSQAQFDMVKQHYDDLTKKQRAMIDKGYADLTEDEQRALKKRYDTLSKSEKREADKQYKAETEAAEKARREKENALLKQYEKTGDKESYESSMEILSIESLETQKEIAKKYGKDTTKIEQSLIEANIQHRENECDRKTELLNQFTEEEKDCLKEQLENREVTQEQYDKKTLELDLWNAEQRLKVAETYNQDTADILREQRNLRMRIGEQGYTIELKQLDEHLAEQKANLTRQLADGLLTQEQYDRQMLEEKVKYYQRLLDLDEAYNKSKTGHTQDWLDARIDLRNFDQSAADKKAQKTGTPLKNAGDAWSGVKGVADSFREIKSAIEDTDNAWDALTKTVDGFIGVFKNVTSVIEAIKKITEATDAMALAKTKATVQLVAGNAEESASETAAAGVSVSASNIKARAARTEATANAAAAVTGAGKSVASIPYVGAILAVAAIASVIAALANIPKFANGGVVYGPTVGLMGEYAGAASNPEVIAPLSKLQGLLGGAGRSEVKFRIEGRELVGILNKQNNIYNRNA